jgi:hypothetical protein
VGRNGFHANTKEIVKGEEYMGGVDSPKTERIFILNVHVPDTRELSLASKETSRCPKRAFVCHFRVSFVIGQIMSNHVLHVQSCHSCQIMSCM